MSVHLRIKSGRLRLGLTEEQFAKRVGVSRAAVQQWEKSEGTAPSRRNQPAVASLLGLSVSELMNPGGSDDSMGAAENDLSPAAYDLGKLFDMLPHDRVLRALVYNSATTEILKFLPKRSS